MNFNPMDLIKIKEYLCDVNSKQYKIITNFISFLIDMENKGGINCKLVDELGENFFKKQEMIQKAYETTDLEFNFKRGK